MSPEAEIILYKQYSELVKEYRSLDLKKHKDGLYRVYGEIDFIGQYESQVLEGKFNLEIEIPDTYPDEAPKVKETGGRIRDVYEHLSDGYLCLGTDLEVEMIFAEQRTLIHFVNVLVRTYLYGFCYWEKYGKMPSYNARSHKGTGVLEYYKELLKVDSSRDVFRLMDICYTVIQNKDDACPCGSGLPLRFCHQDILLKIAAIYSVEKLNRDLYRIVSSFKKGK